MIESLPLPLRAATVDDVDAMHRVRMAVRENVLSDPALVTPASYRRMLEHDGRGWVFEDGGAVVGFAVADRVRRNVWSLFVHPAHEGRGIGRRLHDTVVAWLFAAGADRVWLGTDPGTRAERFYAAAGWERAGTCARGEVRFEMSAERYRELAARAAKGGA